MASRKGKIGCSNQLHEPLPVLKEHQVGPKNTSGWFARNKPKQKRQCDGRMKGNVSCTIATAPSPAKLTRGKSIRPNHLKCVLIGGGPCQHWYTYSSLMFPASRTRSRLSTRNSAVTAMMVMVITTAPRQTHELALGSASASSRSFSLRASGAFGWSSRALSSPGGFVRKMREQT